MLQAMLLAAIVLKASEHNLVAAWPAWFREPGLAPRDPAMVSAGPRVLGVERVLVRRLPDLCARVDVPQPPRGCQYRRRRTALAARGLRRAAVLRVPVGDLDALGTEHWRRRITPTTRLSVPDSELPMISLHVPAHNEPPGMVIETLRSLLRLDYPRYEVILIDDNTDDESLWRPVEAWCDRHGVKFAHLDNWPGYKSGALNYALHKLTSPDAELIGVVDSDYQLQPGFLPPRPRAPRPLRAPLRAPVPPRPPHRPPPPRPPPPQLCPPHRLPPPQSPPRLPWPRSPRQRLVAVLPHFPNESRATTITPS